MKKYIIAPVIWSLISAILAVIGYGVFSIPNESAFHFNLITINSIFAGFLYTNYSILIGLSDKELIKRIGNTNIIEKRNAHILSGIVCSIVSIISSLIIAIEKSAFVMRIIWPIGLFVNNLLANIEITFMLASITYFALSMKEMYVLVGSLQDKSNKVDKKTIESFKELIKGKD